MVKVVLLAYLFGVGLEIAVEHRSAETMNCGADPDCIATVVVFVVATVAALAE